MNITKIIILLVVCMSCTEHSDSQEKIILDKPKVDKRVELLSIVSRLAGYNEYSSTVFKLYTDRIEKHFAGHKNHELVTFMKDMRASKGISYDAVMAMAIHLDEELNPRTEFTNEIPEARWGKDNADKFVSLLKKFYSDAKCKEFFETNKELYEEVSDKFLPVYQELDLSWYNKFYGKEPSEKFIIVNGLGNGGGNYGVSFTPQNGQKEIYAIMGTWTVDNQGMATFNKEDYFPTLLHEFNHSFVNYLIEDNEELFRDSGEKIFEVVKNEMANQAYGNWRTMFNEALVRASVIKYMIDHNFSKEEINKEVKFQLDRSFLWISPLVKQLMEYDNQRETYPTLESYIPKLAEAYKTYTIPEVVSVNNYELASIDESNNGDIKDSWLEQIEIRFSIPMLGDRYSLHYGEKGKEAFPEFKKIYYSEDNESLILEFGQLLKKDKEYQFILKGENFKSQAGVSMKDKEINFKTPK